MTGTDAKSSYFIGVTCNKTPRVLCLAGELLVRGILFSEFKSWLFGFSDIRASFDTQIWPQTQKLLDPVFGSQKPLWDSPFEKNTRLLVMLIPQKTGNAKNPAVPKNNIDTQMFETETVTLKQIDQTNIFFGNRTGTERGAGICSPDQISGVRKSVVSKRVVLADVPGPARQERRYKNRNGGYKIRCFRTPNFSRFLGNFGKFLDGNNSAFAIGF